MVATVFNLTSASSTVHLIPPRGSRTWHTGERPRVKPGAGSRVKPGQAEAGDYYARKGDEHRKASRWRGGGAAALGLTGHVEPGALSGGCCRAMCRARTSGWDGSVTANTSTARGWTSRCRRRSRYRWRRCWAGRVRPGRCGRTMRRWRATLDHIETRLLRTRRWSREERRSVQVNAPALVAATFRHITSRNNDPQLHTHCVVANMTCESMEQWRECRDRSAAPVGEADRGLLPQRAGATGCAGRASRCSPSMIGRVPGFEISGWPRAVLEAFSSRRRQIVKYIREKGWRYNARAAQAATLATRVRKNEPRRSELEALWRDFAEEHGLAKRTLRKIGVRRPVPPTALEIAWQALAQLEERASVFPARDALALELAHYARALPA